MYKDIEIEIERFKQRKGGFLIATLDSCRPCRQSFIQIQTYVIISEGLSMIIITNFNFDSSIITDCVSHSATHPTKRLIEAASRDTSL